MKYQNIEMHFTTGRGLYLHYRLNNNKEGQNVIKVNVLSRIAASPHEYFVLECNSSYKRNVLNRLLKSMDSLKDLIIYNFDNGTPKNFSSFCNSKLIFELLDYEVVIEKKLNKKQKASEQLL